MVGSSPLLRTDLSLEELVILGVTLLFPPVLLTCALVIVLGTFGKSLGIRKAYVSGLLAVFEWATKTIKLEMTRNNSSEWALTPANSEEELSEGETPKSYAPKMTPRRGSVIARDSVEALKKKSFAKPEVSQVSTVVEDTYEFIRAGVEAIVEDEVTSRFEAAQLATWNLLTRTSFGYQYVSWKLTLMYYVSLVFRYCILLPGRIVLVMFALSLLVICTTVIGHIPNARLKKWLYWHSTVMCFRICSRGVSAIVTYHDPQFQARAKGICVANHTSPMDVIFLSCDRPYALVGQKQGGLLGVIQRALNRATHHIWFERAEVSDRLAVARRLAEHVEDENKLPILIFPEGTCINNTSVMQFKKGSFEVGGTIYPVAIKYDSRFGDPFWNSSAQSYVQYLVMMMTSWAIVCDVYYLPPMTRLPDESGIAFASRAKRAIAEAGGLIDLEWDGQLKRYPVKVQQKEEVRNRYSKRINAAQKLPIFSDDFHLS